jgi:hypothetical protein
MFQWLSWPFCQALGNKRVAARERKETERKKVSDCLLDFSFCFQTIGIAFPVPSWVVACPV